MQQTTSLPKAEILDRYAAGESIRSLARAYGRRSSTIQTNLRQWGASIRQCGPIRTYALTENFFHDIETEQQAYWLGFILADGCVSRFGVKGNWRCRVELAGRDQAHLHKLAAAVGTDAPIKLRRHDTAAYLVLYSAQLCRDLCSHECGPNKTGNHGTPKLDDNLCRHFYRGYFDGDGSLYYVPSTHTWGFAVIGATQFIKDFQRWLISAVRVGKTKLHGQYTTSTSELGYSGTPQTERIARLLYEGATVFLDRKYQSYLALLNRPHRRVHNLAS